MTRERCLIRLEQYPFVKRAKQEFITYLSLKASGGARGNVPRGLGGRRFLFLRHFLWLECLGSDLVTWTAGLGQPLRFFLIRTFLQMVAYPSHDLSHISQQHD